jgi:TPR repeat protein
VLLGHSEDLWSAAWSPDGRRIVTASTDRTVRIWDAASGGQLAVLAGHREGVLSVAWSPDGQKVISTAGDLTVRIWDANVTADLDAQLAWSQAAKINELPELERSRLGLLSDARVPADDASECDRAAAAPYDPDRWAPGVARANISVSIATSACAQEIAESGAAPRLSFQLGRSLLAKNDIEGAKREFELAVSGGYRAAQVELAGLLGDPSASPSARAQAVAHYEKAWRDGVPIAAFELGQLFEREQDSTQAWSWYRKGADIGEPNALARFGERDDAAAFSESSPEGRHAYLLKAFASYAAAAERARAEGWPDDIWKHWRFRRATLARLLAREGMMLQVADAYASVGDMKSKDAPAWLEEPGDAN